MMILKLTRGGILKLTKHTPKTSPKADRPNEQEKSK